MLGMRLTLGIEGDVAHHAVSPYLDDVDGAEIGTLLGEDRCQPGELAGDIGDLEANGHAKIAVGFLIQVHGAAPEVRGSPGIVAEDRRKINCVGRRLYQGDLQALYQDDSLLECFLKLTAKC